MSSRGRPGDITKLWRFPQRASGVIDCTREGFAGLIGFNSYTSIGFLLQLTYGRGTMCENRRGLY